MSTFTSRYKSNLTPSLLLPFLIMLVFTSCKDSSTGSDDILGDIGIGKFSAEISGDITQEISGVAIFGTQVIDGPTGNIFVLTMSTINSSINYTFGVTLMNTSRPGNGDRSIGASGEQNEGYFVVNPSDGEISYYESQSGQLRITSSSSESLQGELTLNAVLEQSGNEITIAASFNASCESSEFSTCD